MGGSPCCHIGGWYGEIARAWQTRGEQTLEVSVCVGAHNPVFDQLLAGFPKSLSLPLMLLFFLVMPVLHEIEEAVYSPEESSLCPFWEKHTWSF